MSPKTTPSAAMTSLREASLRGSAPAAGELACMGRALYRNLLDDRGQPAGDHAAEAGTDQRRDGQMHESGIAFAEPGALRDQRLHHARIAQPGSEAERQCDSG